MSGVYKIRWAIITILGLVFSFALSCKKIGNDDVLKDSGTVVDVDGNVYKTIRIGNQLWMAEDLKVKNYRNGTPIYKVQFQSKSDTVQWITDSTGSYCDNTDNAGIVIGKFYNWFALNNSAKIAPEGWHIPSDNEWKELEKHLGMNQTDADQVNWRGTHEGEKLKIESPKGWTTYGSVWSTNESGFTALASGCRLFDGRKGTPGLNAAGFWWTSSDNLEKEACYRYLDYKNANVFRSYCSMNYGFSVRCIKD